MSKYHTYVLKSGSVVTDGVVKELDIILEGGKIARLGSGLRAPNHAIEIDISGKHVIPGVIDGHVHLREFEYSAREDFYSGTSAAAVGGITTVMDMPNSNPKVTTPEAFRQRRARVEERAYVNIGLYGWAYEGNVDALEDIWSLGAVGLKIFAAETGIYSEFTNFTVTEPQAMFQILERVAAFGGLTAIHSESQALMAYLEAKARANLRPDLGAYLAARPLVVEDVAVFSEVAIAKHWSARIHICHVVGKGTVDFLRWAKREYHPYVSCEVTPHNLLLTEEECRQIGSLAKFSPPVHDIDSKTALWEGLKDGTIDFIGSDHAPQDNEKKKLANIWEAPPGSPELDYWVPLILDRVADADLSWQRFVEVTSKRPAQIFGLYPKKGVIAEGSDADVVVVDMASTTTIDPARFMSKARYSPFAGRTVRGVPLMTFVNGHLVARNGEIVAKPGVGKFVSPNGATDNSGLIGHAKPPMSTMSSSNAS